MVRYDPIYKKLFESSLLVEDLLREMLAEHPEFVNAVDFTTMHKIPGEMITEALRSRFVDCVWQIELAGRRNSVVVILEFQSTIDSDMGLRILVYSSLLLQKLIGRERYQSASDQCYPIIVPVVMYNGKRPWNAALDVRQRFDVIEGGLLPFQPAQRYMLVDEKQWVERLPERHTLFRALLTIIHSETPEQMVLALAAVNERLDDVHDRELKQGIVDLFLESAREKYWIVDNLPEGMTMGELHNALSDSMDEWPREWEEKGRKKGVAEGLDATREILRQQLTQKFGELPESASERIEQADYSQMQRWAGRVIEAESLDQILHD